MVQACYALACHISAEVVNVHVGIRRKAISTRYQHARHVVMKLIREKVCHANPSCVCNGPAQMLWVCYSIVYQTRLR